MHTIINNLAVGHCNIQGGLTNLAKTLQVQELIFREKLDILGINETNLKSDIDTSTLNLPHNFNFIRKDRKNNSRRGGCGLLISKSVKYELLELDITYTNMMKIEGTWIELLDANIYLCCFYRSQSYCPLDTFLDYMTECMMKLQGKKVIWLGDINVNQNCITDLDYKKLDITMKLFGMVQVVQDITRIANLNGRTTQSTIDVVMTNCYSHFLECNVLDDRIGDHQALKCTLNIKVQKASKFQKILIRDQSLNNLKDLSYFLGQCSDYRSILSCNDVNEALNGLNHHIKTSYEHFCPVKQIKCKSNFLAKPSTELLAGIRKKKLLFGKFKKCVKKYNEYVCKCKNSQCKCRKAQLNEKCMASWKDYKKQRNNVTQLSRQTRRSNIITDLTAKSARNDLKGIWKTIKHASNIGSKKASTSPNNLNANVLNNHFATIGSIIQNSISENDTDNFMDFMPPPPECKFSIFEEVTVTQVKDYITSIPSDKSINDIMPMKVYKYVICHIIEPVTHIVNLSLRTGVMPSECKIASVAPILKGGDPGDPNNYRPISILPLIGKCIEYFVNQQFTEYIEKNGLITNHQYGFRKDHSTTFLMLDLFDKIFSAKESNKKPAIVFLDIKKAFDSVSHNVLLKKLKYYGVDGYVIKWFESYLHDRMQFTKINGTCSKTQTIHTGVPQGSILGPILFSLFINDLCFNCKQSQAFLFADDSALYFNNVVRGVYYNIKEEMKLICKWFRINKLKFNADKTSLLIFDRLTELDSISLTLENGSVCTVNETKSQKYLGLMIDNLLNFQDHIEYVKSKVAKRIGALYRSKNLLPLKYRKMFVNALMLPQFDYLDIIWCRAAKTRLNSPDILYKKVAKIALDVNIREPSVNVYRDMKWLPLHLRRQLHLSSYMYKIINGLAPPVFTNKFAYISGGSRDAEMCNLYIPKSKSHKCFSYLGAKCWNSTPTTIRTAESCPKFAQSLKCAFLSEVTNNTLYNVNNSYDIFLSLALTEDSNN